MKQRAWTFEQRSQQAERMRARKVWQHSTGPTTPEGKRVSRMNGWRHGMCCAEVRNLSHQLAEWKRALSQVVDFIGER